MNIFKATNPRRRWSSILIGLATLVSAPPSLAQQFTPWGWPQPYEVVSDQSIAWLKSKGWWPVAVAWQPRSSGQNAVNAVMAGLDLLGKRGITASFRAFGAGPAIGEAVADERMQVGTVGNVPFILLLDRKVPVKALAISSPNVKNSIVVPIASPLKSLADLKGVGSPEVVGLVMGSSAEFYFAEAARAAGLDIGKDVILKDTAIDKQLLLPSGLAAVVPWEPSVTVLTDLRKTGREIDTIFPYNFSMAYFLVRQELVDNVPDVVQAISDAHQEAALWIRLNPTLAVNMLANEPMSRKIDTALMLQQVESYNNLFEPTQSYPFAAFWSEENARVAAWLFERGRIQRAIGIEDLEASVDRRFIDKTYDKLGWRIPARPPFLPADWHGRIGAVPYPPYFTVASVSEPRAWPKPGDLLRPWQFDGRSYQP